MPEISIGDLLKRVSEDVAPDPDFAARMRMHLERELATHSKGPVLPESSFALFERYAAEYEIFISEGTAPTTPITTADGGSKCTTLRPEQSKAERRSGRALVRRRRQRSQ